MPDIAPKPTLTVALVQADLKWEDPLGNVDHLTGLADAALAGKASPDAIILPEMFTTGFSMNPRGLAEPHMQGPGFQMLLNIANRYNALAIGSLMVEANGLYWNRMYAVQPDGTTRHYNKRHLFRMAKEDEHYTPGDSQVVVEWRGWRLGLQVCYDLRFPVWSRNAAPGSPGHYHALIYVANWPQRRAHHWRSLLVARAIENQAYVLGVNRTGVDGKGIAYSGDTLITDPQGMLLADADNAEGVHIAELEATPLLQWRESFPAWQDADEFHIMGIG